MKRKDRDFATGKPVDLQKPEEQVRQDTERWLIEELGYMFEQIDIEHRIRIGSSSRRVDITVFKTGEKTKRHQHTDVLGLIETKYDSMVEAEEQLWSYMAVSTGCEWGVAATPEARQFYRKSTEGKIERIPAIPVAGLSVNEVVRLKKSELQPARNLKLRFRSILYHLYSNTNIQSRTRLCNEMTKMLFCKIYDENLESPTPYFQVSSGATHEEVKGSIEKNLWAGVLMELSTAGVFSKNESIILDPDSVAYVVGELERISLKNTDCDAIGAAYEVFAEKYFVGEKGEFFTPRIAVKHAVKLINPNYAEKIIDPACGSGGFIIYALEHVWDGIMATGLNKKKAKAQAPLHIYGIDKEPDLVKVARSYMALIGDGHTNIVDADSLKPMEKWSERSRVVLSGSDGSPRKFDIVLTNPPFGADIKVKHSYILENFDLGHKWERNKISGEWQKTGMVTPTAPQILFLELCVRLLNAGGRMCIVLPESVLGNPTQSHVRHWILDNLKILAIWDCPQNLFLPHTNTKTCILFAEKTKTKNQVIMMSVLKKSGHDARGAEVRSDTGDLVEDFSKAATDWENRPAKDDDIESWQGEVRFFITDKRLLDDDILVPRVCRRIAEQGPKTVKLRDLEGQQLIKIRTVPCDVRQSEYEIGGAIPFIRTTDFGNMELRPPVHRVTRCVYERNRNNQDVKALDIFIIKDGTYRIGESVILLEDDIEAVLQGHFYKIRVLDDNRINPYYLYWALRRSHSVILDLVLVQSTLSSITIDRLRDIRIPFMSEKVQEEIGKEMESILCGRKAFLNQYNDLSHKK